MKKKKKRSVWLTGLHQFRYVCPWSEMEGKWKVKTSIQDAGELPAEVRVGHCPVTVLPTH